MKQLSITVLVLGGTILANGVPSFASGNGGTSSSTNIFTQAGSLIDEFVGATAGVSVAWLLFEIYHLAFLIFRGGTNVNKRDEAKTHAFHIAIAGGLIGSSGLVLKYLLHLF